MLHLEIEGLFSLINIIETNNIRAFKLFKDVNLVEVGFLCFFVTLNSFLIEAFECELELIVGDNLIYLCE
jgi:hypothetical protein